jgi:hypothetical protein
MKYEEILNAPRWEPRSRVRMPMEKRAAQFQPFDPLEGYSDEVEETARDTDAERWLDETSVEFINRQLAELQRRIREQPGVTVTFFEPDERKSGGAYRTVTGKVKKLDEYGGQMVLADGTVIPLERILSMETTEETGGSAMFS